VAHLLSPALFLDNLFLHWAGTQPWLGLSFEAFG